MTLYAIYNSDGSISQANKVYDPKGLKYDEQLRDGGYQFVKAESAGLLPPDQWYVDVAAQQVAERPYMSTVQVNKKVILPGDQDSCLITGIMRGTKVLITMRDGTVVYPKDHPKVWVMDETELEISIPSPCVYRIHLDLWPYKTFKLEIEAVVP